MYNFDIPQDPDSYVHRIGRTGRAGKAGLATLFVTPRELKLLRAIEKAIARGIARRPIPSVTEAREEKMRAVIEKMLGVAENRDTSFYRGFAEGMLEVKDSVTIIAAALSMIDQGQEAAPVELTEARQPGVTAGKTRKDGGHGAGSRRPKAYGGRYAGARRG